MPMRDRVDFIANLLRSYIKGFAAKEAFA